MKRMDVSDGLVGDLTKMLGVSGIGDSTDVDTVPLSDAAREPSGRTEAFSNGR